MKVSGYEYIQNRTVNTVMNFSKIHYLCFSSFIEKIIMHIEIKSTEIMLSEFKAPLLFYPLIYQTI